MTRGGSGRGGRPRVVYHLPRRVDSNIGTQRYFALALSQVADVRVRPRPLHTRLRPTPERVFRGLYAGSILRERSRLPWLRSVPESGATGRYTIETERGLVRFAIDARDGPAIYDQEALAWSDVFFKANFWPEEPYPEKVRPLVNGNGRLDQARLDRLVALRDAPKDIDICFVSNIWGGREHNVRLFEELARLDARSELRAVFVGGFPEGETMELKERLSRAGITATDTQMPVEELWQTMARSRTVFFRPGKHLCLPWRTIDLLAMGACIVMDAVPVPQWYEPFRRDVNFVACMDSRPSDTTPASDEDYARIVPTVERLLADDAAMARIRESNAAYFDRFVAPARLGEHILAEVVR